MSTLFVAWGDRSLLLPVVLYIVISSWRDQEKRDQEKRDEDEAARVWHDVRRHLTPSDRP